MDFFLCNLEETLKAINKLIDNKINIVNTKRIRRCNNIKSSDRSKINFIWRSLKYLTESNLGVLERDGVNGIANYKITVKEKINIPEILSKIEKERIN